MADDPFWVRIAYGNNTRDELIAKRYFRQLTIFYDLGWIRSETALSYLNSVQTICLPEGNAMKIDHRSLLIRYIRHVTECEGTNYICRIGDRMGRVQITEEEVAELKALEEEGDGLSGWKPTR